jgi:hypothetical protein
MRLVTQSPYEVCLHVFFPHCVVDTPGQLARNDDFARVTFLKCVGVSFASLAALTKILRLEDVHDCRLDKAAPFFKWFYLHTIALLHGHSDVHWCILIQLIA